MDQSGVPLAVSLLCDINTGKNQSDSDCTNCLKCLRIDNNTGFELVYVHVKLEIDFIQIFKI